MIFFWPSGGGSAARASEIVVAAMAADATSASMRRESRPVIVIPPVLPPPRSNRYTTASSRPRRLMHRDAAHLAPGAGVVVQRVMQHATIIPDADIVGRPPVAAGEFGPRRMLPQEL